MAEMLADECPVSAAKRPRPQPSARWAHKTNSKLRSSEDMTLITLVTFDGTNGRMPFNGLIADAAPRAATKFKRRDGRSDDAVDRPLES